MTSKLDLEEIEKRAKAATPGSRHVYKEKSGFPPHQEEVWGIYTAPNGEGERIVETDAGYYPPHLNDAEQIASCSPEVVLEMVRRIRGMQEALEHYAIGPNDSNSIAREALKEFT